MTINGEEVELVTSFDELRIGMIVWCTPCAVCSQKHRYMTVLADFGNVREPNGNLNIDVPFFVLLPKSACCKQKQCVITAKVIDERRAYGVVDPLLDAATTARKREAART